MTTTACRVGSNVRSRWGYHIWRTICWWGTFTTAVQSQRSGCLCQCWHCEHKQQSIFYHSRSLWLAWQKEHNLWEGMESSDKLKVCSLVQSLHSPALHYGFLQQFFLWCISGPWVSVPKNHFGCLAFSHHQITGDTVYNLMKLGELETDKNDRPLNPPNVVSVEVRVVFALCGMRVEYVCVCTWKLLLTLDLEEGTFGDHCSTV